MTEERVLFTSGTFRLELQRDGFERLGIQRARKIIKLVEDLNTLETLSVWVQESLESLAKQELQIKQELWLKLPLEGIQKRKIGREWKSVQNRITYWKKVSNALELRMEELDV